MIFKYILEDRSKLATCLRLWLQQPFSSLVSCCDFPVLCDVSQVISLRHPCVVCCRRMMVAVSATTASHPAPPALQVRGIVNHVTCSHHACQYIYQYINTSTPGTRPCHREPCHLQSTRMSIHQSIHEHQSSSIQFFMLFLGQQIHYYVENKLQTDRGHIKGI